VHNSVTFSTFTLLCNHHHKFHISSLQKETPYPWAVTPHPHPQANPRQPLMLSILSGMYLEVVIGYIGIAGLYGNSKFNSLRSCQTVFKRGCTIHPHQQCMMVLISPRSCRDLPSSIFFILAILVDVKWYLAHQLSLRHTSKPSSNMTTDHCGTS